MAPESLPPADAPQPSATEDAPCLYTAVLDAGDRLAVALVSGDLGGAARLLGERGRILTQMQGAPLAPPSPELAERFKVQDAHLTGVLRGRLATVGNAIATTGRAALAHDSYASSTAGPAPVLDTAPRRG